jgi:hypothetical protein
MGLPVCSRGKQVRFVSNRPEPCQGAVDALRAPGDTLHVVVLGQTHLPYLEKKISSVHPSRTARNDSVSKRSSVYQHKQRDYLFIFCASSRLDKMRATLVDATPITDSRYISSTANERNSDIECAELVILPFMVSLPELASRRHLVESGFKSFRGRRTSRSQVPSNSRRASGWCRRSDRCV